MNKKEMIKIIQKEEARLWKQGERLEKRLERGLYVTRNHLESLIERISAEWTAISVLMDKLDIKKLDN
tara:strand:+ start:230 stop:433 length:204 start_codon:yes stop_codon:yes gene_type:complete